MTWVSFQSQGGQVANPSLEGGQVALLRLHAAVSSPRNDCTILAELGERITQLQYLLHFLCELPRIPKRRSSQNDLKANFAEINFYEVRAY